MPPVITVFADSPDRGRGLARDMRVRWALAEVGQAYDARLLSFSELKAPAHLAVHPFGQIPTFEHEGAAMFETGAIVLHIAEQHMGLLPGEASERAKVLSWIFAAVGTVEPVIVEREMAGHVEREYDWYSQRLPIMEDRIRNRLANVASALGSARWLVGQFSAADLLMIDVLRRLGNSTLLEEFPSLCKYVARGEARPAFKAAFDAQLAIYQANQARVVSD
jgi:glutathione S-transferase